jgi:hypothetical protein
MGYHAAHIERGEYGKLSKIREEFEELCDAVLQDNKVMALCELSDMLGAIEGWLEQNAPDITLHDLLAMKDATRRAFLDGTRTPRR